MINREMPMLSILTIAYNQKVYTQMLFESLANAICADIPYQLIFINNGSQDSTEQLFQGFHFEKNSNFIKHIYYAFKSNQGVAAAINKGFELAETELVLQADNDVVFGPQSLSTMLKGRNEYQAEVVSPNWPWIQKRLGEKYFKTPQDINPTKLKQLEKVGQKAPLKYYQATGSCWMCSKTLFKNVGGWDAEYKNICASDDFLWRVALTGVMRMTIPCSIYHIGRITRCHLPLNSEQQEKDLQRFAQKWGGHPENHNLLREHQKKMGIKQDPERNISFWRKIRSLYQGGKI